jgi:hypothetical protein
MATPRRPAGVMDGLSGKSKFWATTAALVTAHTHNITMHDRAVIRSYASNDRSRAYQIFSKPVADRIEKLANFIPLAQVVPGPRKAYAGELNDPQNPVAAQTSYLIRFIE